MDYGVHGVLLFLHVFCKGDLATGADDVVVVFFDLEVFVTGDVVIQEAGGEFAGEDEAAHAQRVDFIRCENFGGLAQEAVREGPEDIEVDARLGRVFAVFLGEVRGEANGVAEIVGHEARHDGVQVDDDNGLSGGLVEQDVIDFGVVVPCLNTNEMHLVILIFDLYRNIFAIISLNASIVAKYIRKKQPNIVVCLLYNYTL